MIAPVILSGHFDRSRSRTRNILMWSFKKYKERISEAYLYPLMIKGGGCLLR